MPKWFWPESKPEPNAAARAGRFLHWLGYGLAAPLTVYAFINLLLFAERNYNRFSDAALGAIFLALVAAIIGRGSRYILAGE